MIKNPTLEEVRSSQLKGEKWKCRKLIQIHENGIPQFEFTEWKPFTLADEYCEEYEYRKEKTWLEETVEGQFFGSDRKDRENDAKFFIEKFAKEFVKRFCAFDVVMANHANRIIEEMGVEEC